MALTQRERVLVVVSNALAIYAIKHSEGTISPNVTPHKFVLDHTPESIHHLISVDIIDDAYTALTNGS
ncbi:MAG: hypothetical protein F4Y82_06450 [Cenarchaeum sp. SB0665_bin_23]|nr:hypothetical protein [Cenarchaeum sp. SB0667_bin_13]MXY37516.1 hypothetical protein [Cenarchaeum sp. SB0664_bin_35]MXY61731.1 hypothetical protein [Cenarchaeum sp. SB0665_bin_23]MXZ93524.1 hypothetical protein [Cenarchaeum sp. SB0666_bin_15]MYB46698.1 hypothetical protein [Cenarchaeum sp. SB0662_bin_33]MYC78921.1 hypothetical protein [Cenarchaeum sp. SB0661_bin_35]MYD59267.1 hypothetical protein [Cenarchaeum sp. SB0678_bin_8]MYG33623.1 hypothetical protein [Cenarchaeum sp. SB0677_bin_16]